MLVRRLNGLSACLWDVLTLLAVQHRLALIYQRRSLKLHALVQVEVKLWQLKLTRDLDIIPPTNLIDLLGCNLLM